MPFSMLLVPNVDTDCLIFFCAFFNDFLSFDFDLFTPRLSLLHPNLLPPINFFNALTTFGLFKYASVCSERGGSVISALSNENRTPLRVTP